MLLATADLRTRHGKTAQEFMAVKGYPNIRPVGVQAVEEQECWYYYYELPEGLLELEVYWDPDSEQFKRRVTAFVMDREDVRQLLDG